MIERYDLTAFAIGGAIGGAIYIGFALYCVIVLILDARLK